MLNYIGAINSSPHFGFTPRLDGWQFHALSRRERISWGGCHDHRISRCLEQNDDFFSQVQTDWGSQVLEMLVWPFLALPFRDDFMRPPGEEGCFSCAMVNQLLWSCFSHIFCLGMEWQSGLNSPCEHREFMAEATPWVGLMADGHSKFIPHGLMVTSHRKPSIFTIQSWRLPVSIFQPIQWMLNKKPGSYR